MIANREDLIDLATWISEQAVLDVATPDEAVDIYLAERRLAGESYCFKDARDVWWAFNGIGWVAGVRSIRNRDNGLAGIRNRDNNDLDVLRDRIIHPNPGIHYKGLDSWSEAADWNGLTDDGVLVVAGSQR